MDNKGIEQIVHNYIKENLVIEIDDYVDFGTNVINISVKLKDDVITSDVVHLNIEK